MGVDRIIAESGAAKMTLYRNFASKDELILAFLQRREERWTRAWLQAEAEARADTPAGRLLAIFDVFGEWFAREDFEGCSFINVMLEIADPEHPVHQASVKHLAAIRAYVADLAEQAGVPAEEPTLRPPVAHPHEGQHRGGRRGRPRCRHPRARARRAAARGARRLRSRRPSSSDAIAAPLTRFAIFCIAMSRAKSGEPCFGFSSRLKGEKPQSSVAPRRSFGMSFAAGEQPVADLLGRLDLAGRAG